MYDNVFSCDNAGIDGLDAPASFSARGRQTLLALQGLVTDETERSHAVSHDVASEVLLESVQLSLMAL